MASFMGSAIFAGEKSKKNIPDSKILYYLYIMT